MKGLVFVELLGMAESVVGEETVDDVIDSCPLESGGAYNAVGNYKCSELTDLVGAFSSKTGVSVEDLQIMFGKWMLKHFVATYPTYFEAKPDALSMLESIETEVHVEVRKLYPNAELPTFETSRPAPNSLHFTYRSPRHLNAFCRGLIEACLDHYGETAQITQTDRSTSAEGISDFLIERQI